MHSANPERPYDMTDREVPGSVARIHSGADNLGRDIAGSIRGSLRMPPAENTAKNQAAIAAKKADLARQYQAAATPAERARIENQAHELNYLEAIERELDANDASNKITTRSAPNTPGGKAQGRPR